MNFKLRTIAETDYDKIVPVINQWWGGRNMADMLPRLFFVHFRNTSFLIEANNEPIAFLCGFVSQAYPQQAYIHFVGVHPEHRKKGLAKRLYHDFFNLAYQYGCREIHSVTAPTNKGSIAFHEKMGFQIIQGSRKAEEMSYTADYDGPGQDRVLFVKTL